jgi:hypothetical protein
MIANPGAERSKVTGVSPVWGTTITAPSFHVVDLQMDQ